jgi:hypothetical protein
MEALQGTKLSKWSCPLRRSLNDTKAVSAQPKQRRVGRTLASAVITQLIIIGVGLSATHRIATETQYSISEMAHKA